MAIDKSKICKEYLSRLGKSATYTNADGSEENFFAVIEQTWRKNKSHFEKNSTKVGLYYNDYFLYIGPCDFDITKLGENDLIVCDGYKYTVVRCERVIVGGVVQFYTGVLKRIVEEDGNVFN